MDSLRVTAEGENATTDGAKIVSNIVHTVDEHALMEACYSFVVRHPQRWLDTDRSQMVLCSV